MDINTRAITVFADGDGATVCVFTQTDGEFDIHLTSQQFEAFVERCNFVRWSHRTWGPLRYINDLLSQEKGDPERTAQAAKIAAEAVKLIAD